MIDVVDIRDREQKGEELLCHSSLVATWSFHNLLIETTKLCNSRYCCISLSHMDTSGYNETKFTFKFSSEAVMIKISLANLPPNVVSTDKTEHIVLEV